MKKNYIIPKTSVQSVEAMGVICLVSGGKLGNNNVVYFNPAEAATGKGR